MSQDEDQHNHDRSGDSELVTPSASFIYARFSSAVDLLGHTHVVW